MMTQNEVMEKGFQVLVQQLGIVDAIRFLQYYSYGSGDYTKERQQILQARTIDDVLADMQQCKERESTDRFDEVIE